MFTITKEKKKSYWYVQNEMVICWFQRVFYFQNNYCLSAFSPFLILLNLSNVFCIPFWLGGGGGGVVACKVWKLKVLNLLIYPDEMKGKFLILSKILPPHSCQLGFQRATILKGEQTLRTLCVYREVCSQKINEQTSQKYDF